MIHDPTNEIKIRFRISILTYFLVGHEQHDLCDSYILDVVHDATENYFERGILVVETFMVQKHLFL